MDTTTTTNEFLENPAMDFDTFEEFQMMAEEYKRQLLMEELREEINS